MLGRQTITVLCFDRVRARKNGKLRSGKNDFDLAVISERRPNIRARGINRASPSRAQSLGPNGIAENDFRKKRLHLDRFFAGHTLWRMKGCPFCYHAPSSVWLESSSALALWDGFPISQGHTLVVPRCHVCSLFDLSDSELSLVWGFVARVRENLKSASPGSWR